MKIAYRSFAWVVVVAALALSGCRPYWPPRIADHSQWDGCSVDCGDDGCAPSEAATRRCRRAAARGEVDSPER
jgi:hypothetical protein